MLLMTKQEKARLAFYRTKEGEEDWRVSDLAWADYQRLEEKEKRETEDYDVMDKTKPYCYTCDNTGYCIIYGCGDSYCCPDQEVPCMDCDRYGEDSDGQ